MKLSQEKHPDIRWVVISTAWSAVARAWVGVRVEFFAPDTLYRYWHCGFRFPGTKKERKAAKKSAVRAWSNQATPPQQCGQSRTIHPLWNEMDVGPAPRVDAEA